MCTLYAFIPLFIFVFKFGNNSSITFIFCKSWDAYFRNSTAGASPAYQAPPSLAPSYNQVPLGALLPLGGGSQIGQAPLNEKIIDDHLAVQAIIRSYQVREL